MAADPENTLYIDVPAGRVVIAITVDGMPKTDYSFDNVGNLLIADLTDCLLEGLRKA